HFVSHAPHASCDRAAHRALRDVGIGRQMIAAANAIGPLSKLAWVLSTEWEKMARAGVNDGLRGGWLSADDCLHPAAPTGHRSSRRRLTSFRQVGLLPNVGFKFGCWIDCILMQRALGPGSTTPPGDLLGH